MELVYLWVKKYKNIHEQGFNFSPKFTCNYDEKSNELTIDENDDYIENFFGKNINVTAIVGKNGSGKSSLLRELIIEKIQIYMDGEFYTYGFKKNNFKKLSEDYHENNIFYVNYDLMYTNDFDCFICHNNYPSSNNLYKKIENGIDDRNNFNGDLFYRNFQKLIIKYSDIFNSRIFNYNPNYITLDAENIKEIFDNKIINPFLENDNNRIRIDIKNFKEIFPSEEEQLKIINNEKIKICIYDNFDREYFSLSQGERKIFTEFLMIYNAITVKTNDNLLLVLDEPDLTLHPDWQKIYFNELISILNLLNKKIHLIFTTHSPFLLSDIPKQNIIFLDTYEDGKCKVLKHDEVMNKKQTFGANIHTLLSDSFFMEDGLMGEFAKGKINEIIEFFDNKNELYSVDKERLYQIINAIGEPFLKEKLLFMYDERFPKTKEEQIAEYEAKIKRLKSDDKD